MIKTILIILAFSTLSATSYTLTNLGGKNLTCQQRVAGYPVTKTGFQVVAPASTFYYTIFSPGIIGTSWGYRYCSLTCPSGSEPNLLGECSCVPLPPPEDKEVVAIYDNPEKCNEQIALLGGINSDNGFTCWYNSCATDISKADATLYAKVGYSVCMPPKLPVTLPDGFLGCKIFCPPEYENIDGVCAPCKRPTEPDLGSFSSQENCQEAKVLNMTKGYSGLVCASCSSGFGDVTDWTLYYGATNCPPLASGVQLVNVLKENCNETASYINTFGITYFDNFIWNECKNSCTASYKMCPDGQTLDLATNSCKVPDNSAFIASCVSAGGTPTCTHGTVGTSDGGNTCFDVCVCLNPDGTKVSSMLDSRTIVSCGALSPDGSLPDDNTTKPDDTADNSKSKTPCDEAYDKLDATCVDGQIIDFSKCRDNGLKILENPMKCVPMDYVPSVKPSDCNGLWYETFNNSTQKCDCDDGYTRNKWGDCWKALDSNATLQQQADDDKAQVDNALTKDDSKLDAVQQSKLDAFQENVRNSLTGIRGDLNGTNALLAGISKKIGDLNSSNSSSSDTQSTSEDDEALGSANLDITGFISDVKDSLKNIEDNFKATKAIITQGFTFQSSVQGCVNPSISLYGKTVTLAICESFSIFYPMFYLIFTILFTYIAIRIYIYALKD